MEIILEKKELSEIIEKLSKVLPVKPPIVSLGCILLEPKKDGISFITTDLQLTLKIFLECSVKDKGNNILIPGKNFISLIKELPEDSIKIFTKDNYLIIENKNFQYKLLTMSSEDFPKLPEKDIFSEGNSFNLSSKDFIDMIKKTYYCINSQEVRIYFRGALFNSDTKFLTMVGTDTRRMGLVKKEIITDKSLNILLPYKLLEVFSSIIKEENINISVSKNQISFNTDKLFLTSQLLEGDFPNYTSVLPSGKLYSAKINTKEFFSSLSRINLLTSREFNSLHLNLKKNSLVLKLESPEVGLGEEQLKIEYSGPDSTIIFNPIYIIDFLKTVEEENVILSFTESIKPAQIIPEGNPNYIYIVMPIKP
ncbi:MAG: DNA polymerase III subunit beta [Candidatus Omnitrophica bacterium]|jgi:DNA polymerase-3 subunit beta|nr:DNA polymerase III subunit beta [Candidatus Omnitrophota bacterium]